MKIPELGATQFLNDIKLSVTGTLMDLKSDTLILQAGNKTLTLNMTPETQHKELLIPENIGKTINVTVMMQGAKENEGKASIIDIKLANTSQMPETLKTDVKPADSHLNLELKSSILNVEREIAIKEVSLIRLFQKNEVEVSQVLKKDIIEVQSFLESFSKEVKQDNVLVQDTLKNSLSMVDLRDVFLLDADELELPQNTALLAKSKEDLETLLDGVMKDTGKLNQPKFLAYVSLLEKLKLPVSIKNLNLLLDMDKKIAEPKLQEAGTLKKYFDIFFKSNKLPEKMDLETFKAVIKTEIQKSVTDSKEILRPDKIDKVGTEEKTTLQKEYPTAFSIAHSVVNDPKIGNFEIYFAERGKVYKNQNTKYAYLKINTKHNGCVEVYCKLMEGQLDVRFSSETDQMTGSLLDNKETLKRILKPLNLKGIAIGQYNHAEKPSFVEFVCEATDIDGRLDVRI